ncbi:Hypothetical protein A7982_09083 [Minicystis rosea]|nr:Hypothetical protein A7982_09083 [Minicystis rosea]
MASPERPTLMEMAMQRRLSWTILGFGALALAACDGSGSVGGNTGGTGTTGSGTSTGTGTIPPVTIVDKVDIVLGIDNSRSMADKQDILSLALSDLITSLTNPPCVDANQQPIANQPASGLDMCPAGSARLVAPINDIHVGIVTTSLGGHGSDSCPDQETVTGSCPGGTINTTNNDKGHLVSRTDPCGGGTVSTYQNQGFLAWDPTQKLIPPGEPNTANFTTSIRDMVTGVGQIGCGYESQLESWYRFLIDPDPYQTITVEPSTLRTTPQGIDDILLQERKDFLRPDSLLAILMLSDENDCSIKEYGQYWFAAQQRDPGNPNKNFYLPKPRSECAVNPNDECCRSCGQDQTGCPADPNCTGSLDAQTDDVNLRCWDQKRRFGIDFLYPVDRYVNGLSSATVPNRSGDLVPNPVFSNLDPSTYPNAGTRDPGLVILAGIVGVPWQDLARDPGDLTKGYKTAEELAHKNNGINTWDVILGDPANYVAPLDPHMIESPNARTGTNPITGTTLAPPTNAAGAGSDAINGHEYTPGLVDGVQVVPDDLQYACIFPLVNPRDCVNTPNPCDCADPKNDNPLCEPTDAANPTTTRTQQARAKAYPGLRQLNVIRDLGPQGVAGSICPVQQVDSSRSDYAYRPSINALIQRVQPHLKTL